MQVPRLLEEKCDGKAWPWVRQQFLSCDEDTGDKRYKQKIELHQKSVLPSTQSKTCVCVGGEILQNRREYYQIGKQLRDKAEVYIKFNS